jgi:hypothetical protein
MPHSGGEAWYSQMLVFYPNTTRRHNNEHRFLNIQRSEDLRFHITLALNIMSIEISTFHSWKYRILNKELLHN